MSQELTKIQIAGFNDLIESKETPYLDLAVWGPNHHRLLKKMRFKGVLPTRDGGHRIVELYGPSSFKKWEESWSLAENAYVGFSVSDLGVVQRYKTKVKGYVDVYEPQAWALIYQADVRARLEHFERVCRRLRAAYERNPNAMDLMGFTPERPWNAVFQKVMDDHSFWHKELELPASSMLRPVASKTDGDAPIAPPPQPSSKRRRDDEDAEDRRKPPRTTPRQAPWQRAHHVSGDGSIFTTNRKNFQLCEAFQTGACASNGKSVICPKDPSKAHQCNRCLGPSHGSEWGEGCRRKPEPVSAKGKGKGKKK